jgi:hypothetical protein
VRRRRKSCSKSELGGEADCQMAHLNWKHLKKNKKNGYEEGS